MDSHATPASAAHLCPPRTCTERHVLGWGALLPSGSHTCRNSGMGWVCVGQGGCGSQSLLTLWWQDLVIEERQLQVLAWSPGPVALVWFQFDPALRMMEAPGG